MGFDDPLLDRAAIEDVFRRLGDRLTKRGVVADLYVLGGAAMAFAYDAGRATRTASGRWRALRLEVGGVVVPGERDVDSRVWRSPPG